MAGWLKKAGRVLIAPGLVAFWLASPLAAAELPTDEQELVTQIQNAIETSNYDALKEIVFWKDAGKIKERIVRYHLNRSIGRSVKSISIEPFPKSSLDALSASGKLRPNMTVTHAVRVIYDEDPIDDTGKLPSSVFLAGKKDDVFRIGLVNIVRDDDDD